MPSHLSTIGFPVENEEDFARLAEAISRDAEVIPVKKGKYLRWAGSAGEELWLQLNSRGEPIGMNPHFSGTSRIRVGIVGRVKRAGDTSLDGSIHAWASPNGDSSQSGEYPFVFDVPDAGVYSDLEIPSIADAQVAAFAHEIAFFDSEDAYDASQGRGGVKFASRSFIPSGMFISLEAKDAAPPAQAFFTGEVVEAAVRTNSRSGMQFYWALVDTLGGRYDVVIDLNLLVKQPSVGGFLSGTFWLSGRLISYPRRKRSWFGQLLGSAGSLRCS